MLRRWSVKCRSTTRTSTSAAKRTSMILCDHSCPLAPCQHLGTTPWKRRGDALLTRPCTTVQLGPRPVVGPNRLVRFTHSFMTCASHQVATIAPSPRSPRNPPLAHRGAALPLSGGGQGWHQSQRCLSVTCRADTSAWDRAGTTRTALSAPLALRIAATTAMAP